MKTCLLSIATAFLAANSFADPPPPHAASTSTNSLTSAVDEHMPDLRVLEYTGPRETFLGEFTRQIDMDGDTIIDDRIGYRTDIEWFRRQNREGYAWNRSRSRIGAHAVESVLGTQFRDALFTAGLAPFRRFAGNGQRNVQGLSPFSLAESLVGSDYWNEHHPYGWIPHVDWDSLTTTPNISLESNMGRQQGGLPIANLSLRCSTDVMPFDRVFGEPRVSGQIILPCDHLFQVVAGAYAYPTASNPRDRGIREVVRIEHWFGPLLISAGVHLRQNERMGIVQGSLSF